MTMDESNALVPATPTRIRKRDKHGLRLNQKQALIALVQGASKAEAAKIARVHPSTLQGWLQNDPAFLTEYQNLLSGLLDDVKHRMSSLLPKAGDVMAEALDADQPMEATVNVTCPDCGSTFPHNVSIQGPNWKVRQRSAEKLLEQHGKLGKTLKVEGEIHHEHTVVLSTDEIVALQLIKRGNRDAVPPDIYESLRQRGEIVEGEYRELPINHPQDTQAD